MIERIWTCTLGILIRFMIAMKCRIVEEDDDDDFVDVSDA